MKKAILVVLVAVLSLALFAQGTKEEGKAVVKTEILISAAASLTDCMNELKGIFMEKNPSVTVTANYGSSGALQKQIEQGAPADLFFSAGVKQMNALKDKGLMKDDSIRDILENKVVLIVPKNGLRLASLDDLKKSEVEKIGVGEPGSVPVGQYTEEAFRNLKLTDALKDKLVYAKDVREVLSWVETGNVQAGLVYATDAMISKDVVTCCAAPEGSHKKVVYPVGVLKDTKHPEEAALFEDFLFSEKAAEVFASYGFTVIK